MKCWKCGQEIAGGTGACGFCGAGQVRGAASSEIGAALRTLYDRYGCRTVLGQSEILARGLGDLVQDVKKVRNQLHLAMEAGLGRLYLEQLQLTGRPDDAFYQRARLCLTEEAGLGDQPAAQIMGWFDEMIGWTGEPARQDTGGTGEPTRQDTGEEVHCGGDVIIGIDLGTSFTRAAVMEGGRPVMIPTPEGGYSLPSAVGIQDGGALVGERARQLALVHPDCAASPVAELSETGAITLNGRTFSPRFLTALLFRRVRRNAEEYLGVRVNGAAIAVPGSATVVLRQAILDAAKIAGFSRVRLVNAPSVAALAYGFEHRDEQKILLCNLGSRSFNVSAVEIGEGVAEVLAHAGDRQIGGSAYDDCIVRWMAEAFRRQTGVDVTSDRLAMARMSEAAERAKIELSSLSSSRIFIPCLAAGGGRDLDVTLTRARFDELTAPLREKAAGLIRQVIQEGRLDRSGFSGVLPVGGASRIPAFRDAVRQAAGVGFLPKVHPDECTALGTAVQAGIMKGFVSGLLVDVNTYSLGLETSGGRTTRLIPRNTTLPAKETMEFTTSADDQSVITVHLLEGGGEMAADNLSLGKYEIKGILPARKGVPRIEVTVRTTVDGLVEASAADKATGRTWQLDVGGALGLDVQTVRAKALSAAEAVP